MSKSKNKEETQDAFRRCGNAIDGIGTALGNMHVEVWSDKEDEAAQAKGAALKVLAAHLEETELLFSAIAPTIPFDHPGQMG